MIVHRDLKPANLMLGGIPHETGTREMVRFCLPGSQAKIIIRQYVMQEKSRVFRAPGVAELTLLKLIRSL